MTQHGAVDVIEFGNYVARTATAPLATVDRRGRPILTEVTWPVMVREAHGSDVPYATYMAPVARREEKGTDVNVASHMLVDVLGGGDRRRRRREQSQ